MSKVIRTLRPQSVFRYVDPQIRHTRRFISLPGTEPQSITATRILPYKSTSLYSLVSDIDNYSNFIPYCLDSKVTKWSEPDKAGKRWPAQADLKVGWAGLEETFTSRLFCVPGSVVEALGGEALTKLSKSDLAHHAATFDAPAIANNIFKSLSAQWTLKPFHYKHPIGEPQADRATHPAQDQTEVHLSIDFQFANPVYGALSVAVAPKLAGVMIEAFEARAKELLGRA